MSTIKERWEHYRNSVIHKQAGELQLKETRRAFYAGTVSTLEALLELDSQSDEQADAWMAATNDECGEFVKLITEGKA